MNRTAIPMVGKRYGDLVVLAEAPYRKWGGCWQRMVLARCDCGTEWEAQAQAIRDGRINRCLTCRSDENRRRGVEDLSVRLPDGRTVAEIARASGVPLDTVYARWRRGWPEEDLGLPVGQYRGATKGRGTRVRVRPAVTRDEQRECSPP